MKTTTTIKKEIKILSLTERAALHKERHPNDNGTPKENRGVIWSKLTVNDGLLEEFYKTHIYSFIDENDLSKKLWVRISGFTGDEE